MATIKAYSDLQQSKKLAEILPLESADMYWFEGKSHIGYSKASQDYYNKTDYSYIGCWSLAALLGVLPFHLIISNQRYAFSMHKGLDKDGETYMLRYNVFNTNVCLYSTDYYGNPVDACVDMVEMLHKSNLL